MHANDFNRYASDLGRNAWKVMVLGGIHVRLGGTRLHVFGHKEKINSQVYERALRADMAPTMEQAMADGEDAVWQQDGAPCHQTSSVDLLLQRWTRLRLPWAAHSPDLAPIEMVWAAMKRMIMCNAHEIKSREDLVTAILWAWRQVDPPAPSCAEPYCSRDF
jgi:hypothetical protein